MQEIRAKLGENGRIVIPAGYRRALGLKPGDEVIIRLNEEGLHLYTQERAVTRAQALVRRYIPEERSLSGELISERRTEAARE